MTSKGGPKFQNSDRSYCHGPTQADVVGTPDATYSANEQTLLTDLTTAVNAILAALRSDGTIAS